MKTRYAFWNNKGGTGKTSLAFQVITRYAETHPQERILAIDACPQANLSELMLGGLHNKGGEKLLQRHGLTPRCSLGGYFELRLPSPYQVPSFVSHDFMTLPNTYNSNVPQNIWLVCGDPLLELQSNAINTLANQNIPGTDTWIAVVDWCKDFLDKVVDDFDVVFFDCNPSFSMYTQIALASSDAIVLPVMADDSSRRAIQNSMSLLYGLKLPSPIYAAYQFTAKLGAASRPLPKLHLIAKNRLTQYMGPASAYAAVLDSIEGDVRDLLKTNGGFFTFVSTDQGFVDVRDFGTTGVVAFAKGQPFSRVRAGKQTVNGRRVQVKQEYINDCLSAIDGIVEKL